MMIVEYKTKARRNKYPDSGFNLKHYHEYINFQNQYSINIYIVFIDEMLRKMYGNYLNNLLIPCCDIKTRKEYPSIEFKIIYFPLENMHNICNLDELEVDNLKELSNRNYEYIGDL